MYAYLPLDYSIKKLQSPLIYENKQKNTKKCLKIFKNGIAIVEKVCYNRDKKDKMTGVLCGRFIKNNSKGGTKDGSGYG